MSLLEASEVTSFYGDFQALFGINLRVGEGETVALIGANGAGKSTFLRTLTGLLSPRSGLIEFANEPIQGVAAHGLVRRGIAMVPEGRRLFPSLSVEENLLLGGYSKRGGAWNLQRVLQLFPALQEHRKRPSTALSGGQQQMVAIGRALMSNPRLLLCDEISLGLAPIVIRDIYAALPDIKRQGTAVLVVEQDTGQALRIADRVYCFQEGRVSLEGEPRAISREQISRAYFGV